MDVSRTARRLGITDEEAKAAHEFSKAHGREVYAARRDRTRRGLVCPVRSLDDDEARLQPLA
jgi:hypothetical protein